MRLFRLPLSVAATLLVFSSCQTNSSPGIKIDSKLRSYVPKDTTLLAGLDVRALTASPFYQRHAAQLNATPLNEMAAKLGIDFQRDVSYVLLPVRNRESLVIARGTFDPAKINPHLGQESLSFLEKDVVVAGPPQLLQHYLADTSRGIPDSLLARIRMLPAADQVWAVTSKGLPLAATPLSPDVQSMLANLTGYVTAFDAGVALDSGVHIGISLRCDSSEDAKQVYAALRGGVGLARLTTKDKDLALLNLYDAIQITSDAETVHVHADLPPAVADQLVMILQNGSI